MIPPTTVGLAAFGRPSPRPVGTSGRASVLAASNRGRWRRCRRFRAGRSERDGGTSRAYPKRPAIRETAGQGSSRPSGSLAAYAWVQRRDWLRHRATGPWAAFLPWRTFPQRSVLRGCRVGTLYTLLDKCRAKKCGYGRGDFFNSAGKLMTAVTVAKGTSPTSAFTRKRCPSRVTA